MPVVLCYGDSNTHGTKPLTALGVFGRYPRGHRWPDVMAAALGPDVQVIAEGLPGRTTVHDDPVEGGCRNGIAVLPAILHSHRPIDLMVVMLGTNDLKTRFSVSAFEIARSVERICTLARAEGVVADLLVVAPAPVREAGILADTFAGAETRQQGLAAQLEAAARRLGAGFLDAGAHVTVSPVDGVHWEEDAHHRFGAVMAEAVAARLA
ncbi:SGNH/GDSL hydrolase family protein [Roseicyclus persicicus]|uniref:SGNH/GDSL hydrolase family protein n=1 Tax=Roseicyclus persicicus TaxID=2650661 RepID=A0A7X6JXS5_9RHOB|nr:SGNH/GDSL hydrolase family protein [Roseibacterium persicicum]NKX43694.1 SGNH/GDSL hydrolase family protein [Roseibacterium persicicum]